MKHGEAKVFRKVAFEIGLGWVLGKFVGNGVIAIINGGVRGIVKYYAEDGNEFAQTVCDKAKVNYRRESNAEEPEITMGFHM